MTRTFADFGIVLPAGAGGEVDTTCPKCSHQRRNRTARCLSVNVTEGLWLCWHCEWRGSLARGEEAQPKKVFYPPTLPPLTDLPQDVLAFFSAREIPERVLSRNKITTKPTYFPQFGERRIAMLFPYYRGETLVNFKYRAREKAFMLHPGAERILFKLNDIAETTVIVEGELDALACETAGYPNTVSVPDGAPAPNSKGYASKFDFLEADADRLEAVKSWIIAVDNDPPGKRLEEELTRRFGAERCRRVEWPEGCKDANDVLIKHGTGRLKKCLDEAKPFPVEGLILPGDIRDLYDDLYERGLPPGVDPGWPSLAKLYTIRTGEWTLVTGVPSHGKALALDTPLPTPEGWTTMGGVKVGDRLIDETGNACTVTRATEVILGRSCYEVEFSDGTVIVADADHQWLTRSDKARRSAYAPRIKGRENERPVRPRGKDQSHLRTFPSVVTTAEIARTLYAERGRRFNHGVKLAQALDLPDSALLVDPYVLGAWLGDGTSSSAAITSADPEILREIETAGVSVGEARNVGRQGRAATYTLGRAGYRLAQTQESLQAKLRTLGVLNNKHIPTAYLRGSCDQRLALLQGLMDTDGNCMTYGLCEFTSVNRRLAEGVYELCASLGWQPKWQEGRATIDGRDCGPKYRVQVTPDAPVFRLPRKRERQHLKPSKRLDYRQIVAVRPIESVPVRCVEVDSPSHLYLASRAMIPTHNSTWLDALLCNLIDVHGWRVAICSPENQPLQRHMASIAEKIIGLPFGGPDRMDPAEKDLALAIMQDHVSFILPSEPTIEAILDRARIAVARRGITGLVIDPYNEIEHSRPSKLSETEYIGQTLSLLRRFARQYGLHLWLVAHPTKLRPPLTKKGKDDEPEKEPVPTPYDVSGSANWRNKADNCITVYRDIYGESNVVQIHVQKVRFREVGRPGVVEFIYDRSCGRFTDTGCYRYLGREVPVATSEEAPPPAPSFYEAPRAGE